MKTLRLAPALALVVAGHCGHTGHALAAEAGPVTISGHYLGIVNALSQENRTATDARRDQADLAVNLDVEFEIHPRVRGIAQIQGGTGGGRIGLQGPGVNVTDLNLEIRPFAPNDDDEPDLTVTVGSFDTPFGQETAFLANNADATSSAFLLNDLFYSSFGGTIGTLNTVGVMGYLATPWGTLTGAVTNGTDESASNPDGNFGVVVRYVTPPLWDRLTLGVSYMDSDDSEPSGTSGFGADFRAWMADARVGVPFIRGTLGLAGYVGEARYGDEIAATRDDVRIWAGEIRYGASRRGRPWHIAARWSGFDPDDRDGSGGGVSTVLPNPGLAVAQGGIAVVPDQRVRRLQVGGGIDIFERVTLKAEYVRDDYGRLSGGRSTDVDGLLVGLQGAF